MTLAVLDDIWLVYGRGSLFCVYFYHTLIIVPIAFDMRFR